MIVDRDKETIKERINEYLDAMSMKLQTLSDKTGISYRALLSYKFGHVTPSMTNIRLLVQATGLSADYWIGTDRR